MLQRQNTSLFGVPPLAHVQTRSVRPSSVLQTPSQRHVSGRTATLVRWWINESLGGMEASDGLTELVDSMIQDAHCNPDPQTPFMDRSLLLKSTAKMESRIAALIMPTGLPIHVIHTIRSYWMSKILTSVAMQSPSLTSTPSQGPSVLPSCNSIII